MQMTLKYNQSEEIIEAQTSSAITDLLLLMSASSFRDPALVHVLLYF